MYKVVFTKNTLKDIEKLKSTTLLKKVKQLIELIKDDPYTTPPPFKKLVGDLKGAYSRRINIQHRLVYSIHEEEKTIKVIRMWTHYE